MGVVRGLLQVGTGQDVAPPRGRLELQRVAPPPGAQADGLAEGAPLELPHGQAGGRVRRGGLHPDRQHARLARLDLEETDVGRQRRPDRLPAQVVVVEVRDGLVLGP